MGQNPTEQRCSRRSAPPVKETVWEKCWIAGRPGGEVDLDPNAEGGAAAGAPGGPETARFSCLRLVRPSSRPPDSRRVTPGGSPAQHDPWREAVEEECHERAIRRTRGHHRCRVLGPLEVRGVPVARGSAPASR